MALKTHPIAAPPLAILIVGGPGSGKTTISQAFLQDGLVRIDPDAVRETLPEYRELMQRGVDNLAEQTREQANRIADEILENAFRNRHSFVFDASGRDKKWYLELITALNESGFETVVVLAYARPEIARVRCDERAQINGRTVSQEYFSTTHSRVPAHFLDYARAASRFILVKTDGNHPRWIWQRQAGGDVTHHAELLADFLEQHQETHAGAPGSFAGNPALDTHNGWFEQARRRMESASAWDLALETSIRREE